MPDDAGARIVGEHSFETLCGIGGAISNHLSACMNRLADPNSEVASQQPPYAQNETRSIKPEFVVLVGPSGCGKTTLLRALAGEREAAADVARHDALVDAIGAAFAQLVSRVIGHDL